jgi:AAA family ATPase
LIIATTSKLAELDKAVRRGGRLDLDLRLDMPTDQDRLLIFKSHLEFLQLNGVSDCDLAEISKSASGFVGSDLA